jgi:hypothetical protein
MKLYKRLWVPAIIVLLLLLTAIWYSRPVTLPDLLGDQAPQQINILVRRLSDPEPASATASLPLSSPEGAALLEQLQGLSFRRSLTDPLIKPLAKAVNASQGSVSYETGDWSFSLSLTGADGDPAVLNFTVREWSYAAPGQEDFYGCSVPDGEAVGQALAEQFWTLAAESQ